MAITFVDYTATASQTDFLFNFDYLEDEHVVVTVDGVTQTLTTNYTIDLTSTKKIVLSSPTTPIAGGEIVRIRRISAPDENLVDFQNGSVLTESELDRAYLHNRYLAEESAEQNDVSMRLTAGATGFDALNKKIFNVVDPVNNQDAATKNYVDDTLADAVLGEVPDGSITAAKLDTDSVTTVKIEDGAVTSSKISTTDTKFNIQSNGNVGIGTASPAYNFHLANTSEANLLLQKTTPGGQVDGITLNSVSGTGINNRTGDISLTMGTGTGISEPVLRLSTTNGSAPTKHTLFVTNGNVGINNSNPAYKLDVSGDVNVSLGNTFKINGNNLLLDEDTMVSNSDTQGATQQSIKAYVDSQTVSKYSSGWFNDSGGAGNLANGGTYTFTHNLGTDEALVDVWMATDSSGSNAVKIDSQIAWSGTTNNEYGVMVKDITTTQLTVQLAVQGWLYYNASGSTITNNWNTTYTHIKVVALG